MDKEFIPYKEALTLKDLGFDEECLDSYWHDTKHWRKGTLVSSNIAEHTIKKCIKAPLYQQAFRWFREKYDLLPIIIRVGTMEDYVWMSTIDNNRWTGKCNTHEDAELACLRKLIEIVK